MAYSDQEIAQRANAAGMTVAAFAASRGLGRIPPSGGDGYWYTVGLGSGARPGTLPIIDPVTGETLGGTTLPGYGGGGGYGDASATENDKKAGKILAAITNENQKILKDAYDHAINNYNIADEQSRRLAAIQVCAARQKAGVEWYASQQRLHSVVMQLTDQAGNALLSSLWHDMREMLARADDMADAEILNTLRENLQDIENNLFEALAATNNSRNEVAMMTEQQLRQLMTDFAAQLNNIHPDLLKSDDSPTGSTIIDVDASVPAAVNYPSWLNNKTFYDDHKKAALEAKRIPINRPDNAAQDAWNKGLLYDDNEIEAAKSPTYWAAIQDESERRTQ